MARTYRVREVGGGKGLDALEPGPVGWVLPRVNVAWLRAARGGDLGPGSNQSNVHHRSCSGRLRALADQGRRCRSQLLCWVPSLSSHLKDADSACFGGGALFDNVPVECPC